MREIGKIQEDGSIQSKDGWFLPRSALNEPQIECLERFLPHARRAYEIDCKIRKDAKETWYQFDFIKHLVPIGEKCDA